MSPNFLLASLFNQLVGGPVPGGRRRPRRVPPLTLKKLPNEVLLVVFEAVGNQRWVRETVPLVC